MSKKNALPKDVLKKLRKIEFSWWFSVQGAFFFSDHLAIQFSNAAPQSKGLDTGKAWSQKIPKQQAFIVGKFFDDLPPPPFHDRPTTRQATRVHVSHLGPCVNPQSFTKKLSHWPSGPTETPRIFVMKQWSLQVNLDKSFYIPFK